MHHLLILDYRTDAERKRIDYTIEKWSAKPGISVTKPKGVVVLYEGDGLEEFIEDVYSRIEAGVSPLKVYTLEETTHAVMKKERRLEFTTSRSVDTVEDFVKYLLAKLNAAYEYSDGLRKIYGARTRKGHVRITVNYEQGENVRCRISLEGYGSVVDFVSGRIEDEMNVFLGGN